MTEQLNGFITAQFIAVFSQGELIKTLGKLLGQVGGMGIQALGNLG